MFYRLGPRTSLSIQLGFPKLQNWNLIPLGPLVPKTKKRTSNRHGTAPGVKIQNIQQHGAKQVLGEKKPKEIRANLFRHDRGAMWLQSNQAPQQNDSIASASPVANPNTLCTVAGRKTVELFDPTAHPLQSTICVHHALATIKISAAIDRLATTILYPWKFSGCRVCIYIY